MSGNVIVTPDGRPWEPTSSPTDPIASVAQVYDPFASRQLYQEITPEVAARMMRNDYSLSQQQLLCKKILRFASFATSYRNLKLAVQGLDWECLARDKKTRKEQRIAEQVRDYVQQQLEGLPIRRLVGHLLWGEFAPFSFAENVWDLGTKQLIGWEFVDAARQGWNPQTSSLTCLTKKSSAIGEPLAPNMWVVHTSFLFPGNKREGGSWQPALFWFCAGTYILGDALEYAHVFGKPWRLAFIRDPKDKDSVVKALRAIGVNGAGVFPEGTDVKLEGGGNVSTGELFDRLAQRADDAVAELFTGHVLTQKAKSGSGTLAGNGAMKVHEKIVKQVALGIMDTIWRDVILPMVTFRFGYDVAREYTSADKTFKLKYEPPVDFKARAQALGTVNRELLAPLGKAIDLPQVQEEFAIANVVDRVVDDPQDSEDPNDDPQTDAADEAEEASRRPRRRAASRASRRRVSAAKETPATPLRTFDDVDNLATALGRRGLSEIGEELHKALDAGETLQQVQAAIWEGYGKLAKPGRKVAAAARDAMTLAHVIGRADVAGETGGADAE